MISFLYMISQQKIADKSRTHRNNNVSDIIFHLDTFQGKVLYPHVFKIRDKKPRCLSIRYSLDMPFRRFHCYKRNLMYMYRAYIPYLTILTETSLDASNLNDIIRINGLRNFTKLSKQMIIRALLILSPFHTLQRIHYVVDVTHIRLYSNNENK